MIELIPKVKLTDCPTWVDSEVIAISINELVKYTKRVNERAYFKSKRIILLSIFPDELETSYIEMLTRIQGKLDLSRFDLTTADCACYNDQREWCEEELLYLMEENERLSRFKPSIGILKGYDVDSYERVKRSLKEVVNYYLIYVSGEARSNPKYFRLEKFISENFPIGLDKPVFLHGCPQKQFEVIPKLKITVRGIITAQHITDAAYKRNRHYKRKTRIKKSWSDLQKVFSEMMK